MLMPLSASFKQWAVKFTWRQIFNHLNYIHSHCVKQHKVVLTCTKVDLTSLYILHFDLVVIPEDLTIPIEYLIIMFPRSSIEIGLKSDWNHRESATLLWRVINSGFTSSLQLWRPQKAVTWRHNVTATSWASLATCFACGYFCQRFMHG